LFNKLITAIAVTLTQANSRYDPELEIVEFFDIIIHLLFPSSVGLVLWVSTLPVLPVLAAGCSTISPEFGRLCRKALVPP